MATTAQKSDHITRVRSAVDTWLAAQAALTELKREWDALDLGSDMVEADFVGENIGLLPADIAAVYTSLAAELTLMGQGHATNLFKVSR